MTNFRTENGKEIGKTGRKKKEGKEILGFGEAEEVRGFRGARPLKAVKHPLKFISAKKKLPLAKTILQEGSPKIVIPFLQIRKIEKPETRISLPEMGGRG